MSSFIQSPSSTSLQRSRKTYSAKLCFVLDTTGSMHHVRDAVDLFISDVVSYCERKYPMVELKVGFMGYKDVGDSSRYQPLDFTSDVAEFRRSLKAVSCSGGGDEAEDVLGGMNEALKLSWDHQATDVKVLVHIGDSPHHGRQFHDGPVNDNHEELANSPRPYSAILAEFADSHIDYTFAQVKNPAGDFTTTRMLLMFQESYDSNPARKSDFSACAIGEFSPKELLSKIKSSLSSSIQMFMASIASRSMTGAVPGKKPPARSTLSGIAEEGTISSVSSESSGTSKGMDLALEAFASVSSDTEPAINPKALSKGTSVSMGGLGVKKPASSAVSGPPATATSLSGSSRSSASISMGGLGGTKKPVSSSAASATALRSHSSTSVSMGGLGAGVKKPAVSVT